MALPPGSTTKRDGMITKRRKTKNTTRFLDITAGFELSRLSNFGRTADIGRRIFGAKILIATKKRLDATMRTKLTNSKGLC